MSISLADMMMVFFVSFAKNVKDVSFSPIDWIWTILVVWLTKTSDAAENWQVKSAVSILLAEKQTILLMMYMQTLLRGWKSLINIFSLFTKTLIKQRYLKNVIASQFGSPYRLMSMPLVSKYCNPYFSTKFHYIIKK